MTSDIASRSTQLRRVVHVIPSLGFGGCERQLADLIRHADPERYEHAIVYLGPPASLIDHLDGAIGPVIDISARSSPGPLGQLRALRAVLQDLRPAVVHSWLFEADVISRLAASRVRVARVTSLASPAYDVAAARAAGWPLRSVRGRQCVDAVTARAVDPLFVACSQFVASSTGAALRLRSDRVRVIPNSVDPARLAAGPDAGGRSRKSLGLSAERFVVLGVGRLDPQKGFDVLVRAAARVREDVPELAVVLLGDGPLRGQLESLIAELDLEAVVKMPGASLAVADHLAMADAFAFPSRFEGFGMALAEAMTAGLPCVTTALPPVLEFLDPETSGLCFGVDDEVALVAQLRRLAYDPDLRRSIGEAARSAVARRLDVRVTGPQWHRLYDREVERTA